MNAEAPPFTHFFALFVFAAMAGFPARGAQPHPASAPAELPGIASLIPLAGLSGLLSLAASFGLRAARKNTLTSAVVPGSEEDGRSPYTSSEPVGCFLNLFR